VEQPHNKFAFKSSRQIKDALWLAYLEERQTFDSGANPNLIEASRKIL